MGTTTPSEIKYQAQQVCKIDIGDMRGSATGKKDQSLHDYEVSFAVRYKYWESGSSAVQWQ
jgi:hypothetical protein